MIGIFISLHAIPPHPRKSGNTDLSGEWLINMTIANAAEVRMLLNFLAAGDKFTAFSRKGAVKDLLGGPLSSLARIFTNKFKHGSIIRIDNGKIGPGDKHELEGDFISFLGKLRLKGTITQDEITGQLFNPDSTLFGRISGSRYSNNQKIEYYPALLASVDSITARYIFNKDILAGNKVAAFKKKMKKLSVKAQDDLEMMFGFLLHARKLPFSHYALLRKPLEVSESQTGESHVTLDEKSEKTAVMKISSFTGKAREIDSVFAVIRDKGYQNLIVDLRNNPGGSVEAGMAFARHVVDTTFFGGFFLTQRWFNAHSAPPGREAYDQFPHFSEANYDLIIKGIHQEEGLCLKVVPDKPTFSGKLYLLVNKKTGSTCEPIVYGLKQINRATVLGERTAGAMLNGEFFDLPNRFQLLIPTADYFTSDGYKIDRHGVEVDARVKDKKLMTYVLRLAEMK